jgi:beta-lactam-binding protein with PASTA domain
VPPDAVPPVAASPDGGPSATPPPVAAVPPAVPRPIGRFRSVGWRRAGWLALGVAGTLVGGYLVAAMLLFPAPLLPSERQVPGVLGVRLEEAQRTLQEQGFRAEVADRRFHPTYPAGMVTWQDPSPGVAAPRGSTVALTVSEGAARRPVPDVSGLDVTLARALLAAAGIAVARVDTVSGPFSTGVAAGTAPAAGDSVAAGGSVILQVARGGSGR